MHVYKFLSAQYGLKSLVEKRLKISRFDELNDPFELIPYDLRNPQKRWALKAMRSQLGTNRGMLCFSANWRDPVLWAHYADKHQGLCIGFTIPKGVYRRVEYVSRRLPFPKSVTLKDTRVAGVILFTKYSSWRYEQEVRIYAELNDQENGLYYKEFDKKLMPFTVIAGAKCTIQESEIKEVLGPLAAEVEVIKARPGFTGFEIVKDKRGFK